MQANGSGVDFAHTSNNGELRYRHQPDENFNDPTAMWQTMTGQITGTPALAVQPSGRAKVLGLTTTTANLTEYTQVTPTGSTLNVPADLGGTMAGTPVPTTLSDGRQLVVAVAADGSLWNRLQLKTSTDGMSSWRRLGTLTNSTDDLALASLTDGTGALGQVTSLPDTTAPFVGRPSITVYNGTWIRVTAGNAASPTDPTTVSTTLQPSAGQPFDSWTTVGEAGYDLKGSPAAMKMPSSGRMSVLARTGTGELRQSLETVEGSNAFGPWQALPDASDPTQPLSTTSGTDLTSFTYAAQSRWGFVFRTTSGEPMVITAGGPSNLRAQAPTVTVHTLGKATER